jgi:hypothetical protein
VNVPSVPVFYPFFTEEVPSELINGLVEYRGSQQVAQVP